MYYTTMFKFTGTVTIISEPKLFFTHHFFTPLTLLGSESSWWWTTNKWEECGVCMCTYIFIYSNHIWHNRSIYTSKRPIIYRLKNKVTKTCWFSIVKISIRWFQPLTFVWKILQILQSWIDLISYSQLVISGTRRSQYQNGLDRKVCQWNMCGIFIFFGCMNGDDKGGPCPSIIILQ